MAPRAAVIQGDGAPIVLPWHGRALDSTARAKARGGRCGEKGPLSRAGLQGARPGWEQMSVLASH